MALWRDEGMVLIHIDPKAGGGWYWVVDHYDVGFYESVVYPTPREAILAAINGEIQWRSQYLVEAKHD